MLDNDFTIKPIGGKPYRFKKLIFQTAFAFLCSIFIYLAFHYGFGNHFYLRCDVKPMCSNPYYLEWDAISSFGLPYDLIIRENLPYGFVYGSPPPSFAGNEALLVFIVLAIGFLVNHLLYNRRKTDGVLLR